MCFKSDSYGCFVRQCYFDIKRFNCSVISNDDDVAVLNDTTGVPDIINVCVLVNNVAANPLIDTGSMLSCINQKFATANKFQQSNKSNEIGFEVTENCFQSNKVSLCLIHLQNQTYCNVKLHVLKRFIH